ncbi:MAG: hypothetical protein U0441_05400 [Polyangiaceae bacterium]
MKTKSAKMSPIHAAANHHVGSTIDSASVPVVPKSFKPLDGASRQSLLKIFADQRAETDAALSEICGKQEEMSADLGTLAPDTKVTKELLDKMVAARELNKKAQALAVYADEQEALANHAVMVHLNSVVADIEHMASRKPGITEHYEKVLAVTTQRSEAIIAGMARSKATTTNTTAPTPAAPPPEKKPAAPAPV